MPREVGNDWTSPRALKTFHKSHMVRKALLTTQVRGRRWKKQVQIGCLILHFSKGKTPFEVHRKASKDCSSYHFSVILYHASNLKAQVPFERLILIFLPLLIPFSPLAAISSLIQPPMRRNRIIRQLPLNYQREIYAGKKTLQFEGSVYPSKVKRPR